MTRRKWAAAGYELVIEAVSPYNANPADLESCAARLAEARVDLIALDCIGFGKAVQQIVRRITGRPVLCPRTLAARIALEVIGS
jgi:protein AroM